MAAAVALAQPLPALDEPARTGESSPKDTAVVVGVEAYDRVPPVPYALRDARAFYDVLRYTRGIPAERIRLVEGGVKEQILAAVEAAGREAGSDGTVWFYFSGHGSASPETGERLLLGEDVRPDPEVFTARAVPVAEIERLATSGGARAMLVLDTCYAGVGRDGSPLLPGARFAVPSYALAGSPRASVWTAAGPSELSGPLEPVRQGAFTYFVVGALRGWADGELDAKPDGVVTEAEAEAYVHRALRTVQQRGQQPTWGGVAAGDLPLTRAAEPAPALLDEVTALEATEITVPTGRPIEMTASVQATIRRVVQHHASDVRGCYDRRSAVTPGLAGRVTVRFTVGGGKVSGSGVIQNTTGDDALGACMAQRLAEWTWPPELEGQVDYPFVFSPAP